MGAPRQPRAFVIPALTVRENRAAAAVVVRR